MIRAATAILVCLLSVGLASAAERFPPPDFESGYRLPQTTQPPPRSIVLEWTDVAVLAAALAASSWLALRRRSRRGMFALMLLSLAYFGFYRKGCVCPIGAIQNVAMAIFEPSYAVPATVVAFFALPLAAALLFGRTFCASVCPLGAVQDLVVLRPMKVPSFLEQALGLLAWVYLAAAVLLAATGSAFLICQYDPFVAFFRLSGAMPMLLLGGIFLLIGAFVARPYCRFLCPLGAIFRALSPLAWRHATITPGECIRCRLCEDSCPFGAIQAPSAPLPARRRLAGKTALVVTLILLPAMVALGAWGLSNLSGVMARSHPDFRLSQEVLDENRRLADGEEVTSSTASLAFRNSGRPAQELFSQGDAVRGRFAVAGAWMGGLLGLVVGAKLVSVSVRRTRTDYEPDRGRCVSCGRCFRYCPIEQLRLRERAEKGDRP